MKGELFAAAFVVCLVCLCSEIYSVNSTTPNKPVAPTSPVPTVEDTCSTHNASCEDCLSVAGAKCYYCMSNKKCDKYPAKEILPTKHCALSEARWGVCFLNFEALIISMGVIAGVLLIGLITCIYCCCCRSGSNRAKYAKEDAKTERTKTERKMHHEQKKADRKAKNDEIRRKYGLMPDDEGSYHRFEEMA